LADLLDQRTSALALQRENQSLLQAMASPSMLQLFAGSAQVLPETADVLSEWHFQGDSLRLVIKGKRSEKLDPRAYVEALEQVDGLSAVQAAPVSHRRNYLELSMKVDGGQH